MYDLLDQTLYEKKLMVGDECRVRWTSGGNYYSAKAKILKLNNKSARVELVEPIKSILGHYPVGHEIIVPLSCDKKWSENNGLFAPNAPKSLPKIVVQIGNEARTYELYETNAPANYDYGYVITLMQSDHRVVAIPTTQSNYQRGRYSSGLYTAVPVDMALVPRCEELLWNRMYQKLSD